MVHFTEAENLLHGVPLVSRHSSGGRLSIRIAGVVGRSSLLGAAATCRLPSLHTAWWLVLHWTMLESYVWNGGRAAPALPALVDSRHPYRLQARSSSASRREPHSESALRRFSIGYLGNKLLISAGVK